MGEGIKSTWFNRKSPLFSAWKTYCGMHNITVFLLSGKSPVEELENRQEQKVGTNLPVFIILNKVNMKISNKVNYRLEI